MTSARETILSAIETAIAGTTGLSGRIYRGRPYPVALDQTPCIFLGWDTSNPNFQDIAQMDWFTTVRLAVVVRSETAETAADTVIGSAHALLMADPTLGGAALDILPGEQRMDIIEGDKPVGLLTALYVVRHRTEYNSLEAL